MKQKLLIEVDVPDGWDVVDYRLPKEGEFILGHERNHGKPKAVMMQYNNHRERFILRPERGRP